MYGINSQLNKKDKLGIHTKLLDLVLEILKNSIDAGLLDKNNKLPIIKKIRRDIETSKHLIRIESDLKIISDKFYIKTIQELEKISIMTNGWIRSLESRNPQN